MDVLLVEDEALVRTMLHEDLADAGLQVIEAPSAEEALQVAGGAPASPAVMVTDVNLGPGMNGLALVEEARRRWPDIGVVVITGEEQNLRRYAPASRERCLLKPFNPNRLVAEVNGLMGRSSR